jgi:excisionase family DNA binding protein
MAEIKNEIGKKFLTIDEICKMFSLSRNFIYTKTYKRGSHFPWILRIGKHIRIDLDLFLEWAKKSEVASHEQQ